MFLAMNALVLLAFLAVTSVWKFHDSCSCRFILCDLNIYDIIHQVIFGDE